IRVAFSQASVRHTVLRACSQAGLTNNLNDALAWGLAPLYLAAHGASAARIGAVAAVYPGVWGFLQLVTGWLADRTGGKPLIAVGMLVQAGALALLVAGGGAFGAALAAAGLLGLGTALVYPTLIAAVSDVVEPRDRASVVGVYRFWRDAGFVAGALLVGFAADAVGSGPAIGFVAVLTAVSGLVVFATPWQARGTSPQPIGAITKLLLADERPSRTLSGNDRVKGAEMRAIECPCGHHLEGADDNELFRLAREHVDRDHPEMQRTDEQLRARIAADAYDA